MLRLITVSTLLFFSHAAFAQDARIEGDWKRGDGNALVRIAPCGDNICATNLWIRDPSKGEAVGDRLVMSLEPQSASSFAGTAYDPKRKLRYSIVVSASAKSLTTRGCFLGKMLCKDVTWTAAR